MDTSGKPASGWYGQNSQRCLQQPRYRVWLREALETKAPIITSSGAPLVTGADVMEVLCA
jgi:hypothetical protein